MSVWSKLTETFDKTYLYREMAWWIGALAFTAVSVVLFATVLIQQENMEPWIETAANLAVAIAVLFYTAKPRERLAD